MSPEGRSGVGAGSEEGSGGQGRQARGMEPGTSPWRDGDSIVGPAAPWFLRRLLGDDDARALLSELREQYEQRLETEGADSARKAFRWELRRALGPAFVARMRRDPPSPDPRETLPGNRKTGGTVMDSVWQDLRFGFRTLRRRPLFSLIAILTLGLGIGAATAIFSVVEGVLLRPLPYGEPDRLVSVYRTVPEWTDSPNPTLRDLSSRHPVSWATYRDWLDRNPSFEALGVWLAKTYAITESEQPQLVQAAQVSSGVFDALGVPPLLGRFFLAEDDEIGVAPKVVLSHGFWMRRYGGDPAVVGRTLSLEEVPHLIVGVMPRSFYFPSPSVGLWRTVDDAVKGRPDETGQPFWVVGRLREGTTLSLAEARMGELASRMEGSQTGQGRGVRLVDRREDVTGEVRPTLVLLVAAVGILLLVACANLATLLMIRGWEREAEISLRGALGAGTRGLLFSMLTESGLLALGGGILGVGVGLLGLPVLLSVLPPELPRAGEIELGWGLLLSSGAMALIVGLCVGSLPAISAIVTGSSPGIGPCGRTMSSRRSRNRIQRTIVMAEVAVTVVLLVSAGLLGKTMARMSSVDLGFDAENVLTLSLPFMGAEYREQERRQEFLDALRLRLAGLPGVQAVSFGDWVPFVGAPWAARARFTTSTGAVDLTVGWNRVGDSFMEALGIPLVEGRGFDAGDYDGRPRGAIVSERLARECCNGENPIGLSIEGQFFGSQTIIGIAGDIRHPSDGEDLRARPRSLVYLPVDHGSVVSLRTIGDPSTATVAIQQVVQEIDSDLPVVLNVLDQEIRRALSEPRLRTWLVGLFAVVATFLSFVGVFGIINYVVVQRFREIGIRMALGADAWKVRRSVLGWGVSMVGAGLVFGLLVSWNLVGILDAFLFEVSPTDPGSFVAVSVLLLAVGFMASWLPARRATGVDPVEVLRQD